MIKISNSSLIHIFTRALILLLIAKIISIGVWWYLPSDGVELAVNANYQPKYQRVDFRNMIKSSHELKTNNKVDLDKNSYGIGITNMVLKALYGTKKKGFIIVAMKSSPDKTMILSIGESYMGYRLKSIKKTGAILEKSNKDYFLKLEEIKTKFALSGESEVEAYIPRGVTREDISFYSKNPKLIWQDISIRELKDGNNIMGFEVTKINPSSKFATLGLKKGDIIIKANNIKILSYRDALEIYKNIEKLDTISIVIKRDNQEKELVYEIN